MANSMRKRNFGVSVALLSCHISAVRLLLAVVQSESVQVNLECVN